MSGRRAIVLVARREIRERLRSKVFIASTIVMLLLVGGSTALQGALSKTLTYRVAVTAPAPAGLDSALQRAARPFDDAKVELRVVASAGSRTRASSKTRRSTRCCSCPPTGSSSGRTSIRRLRRSQTARCARSGSTCRRRPS